MDLIEKLDQRFLSRKLCRLIGVEPTFEEFHAHWRSVSENFPAKVGRVIPFAGDNNIVAFVRRIPNHGEYERRLPQRSSAIQLTNNGCLAPNVPNFQPARPPTG